MWQILFLPTQTHFALGYRDSIFACSSWLEMGLRFTDIWNIMYLYDSGFQTSPQTKLISSPISYTGVSLGNNPSANPLYFKQCALGVFSGLCSLLESVGGSFTLYNSKMSQPLVNSCRCPPPPLYPNSWITNEPNYCRTNEHILWYIFAANYPLTKLFFKMT